MAVIDHPAYYGEIPGVECIDVVEHFDFCIGSAIKYLWRAGLKDSEADLDDYRKAVWYIQRTITREKGNADNWQTSGVKKGPRVLISTIFVFQMARTWLKSIPIIVIRNGGR